MCGLWVGSWYPVRPGFKLKASAGLFGQIEDIRTQLHLLSTNYAHARTLLSTNFYKLPGTPIRPTASCAEDTGHPVQIPVRRRIYCPRDWRATNRQVLVAAALQYILSVPVPVLRYFLRLSNSGVFLSSGQTSHHRFPSDT